MPANFEKGFSVRENMWHDPDGKWTLGEYPDMEYVRQMFGFEVKAVPMFKEAGPDEPYDEIPKYQALIRTDTGGFLAPARGSYGVIQPEVVVDLTEALIAGGTDNKVLLETGGVLDEGRVIWLLAKVDKEWYVEGDDSPIMPFVLVVNSYDGSLSLMSKTTPVRVVCQNTLSAAIAGRAGATFKFRHTTNVMDRVEEARAVLTGASHLMDVFIEMSNELANETISDEGVRLFLKAFIPEPVELRQTDRTMANVEKKREAVLSILNGAAGTITDRHTRTAYGLYQAGVEFLDWDRKAKGDQARFERAMLGTEPEKRELLTLVKTAAKI